jgi:hypothetical protein
MRGEGGEEVRLRDNEGREAREGVCVQERESTDMWGWEGEDGLGGRMRGEGGEGVRLREDEGREAREGVCVQDRESTDMWAGGGRDSKCPGEGKYRYAGMGGIAMVILCNCGGHNTLNKLTLIFICP